MGTSVSFGSLVTWEAITAFATTLTALVAYIQIRSFRRQERGWRSLAVCERYDSDETLYRTARRLREAVSNRQCICSNPLDYQFDAMQMLNYFDGIAIGIAQRLYVEKIIRAHLEGIMQFHCEDLLSPAVMQMMRYTDKHWPHLLELRQRWNVPMPPLKFKESWWRLWRYRLFDRCACVRAGDQSANSGNLSS